MATVYVAYSKGLGEWAAEVGLTKHVFRLGFASGSAQDALKALNDSAEAGEVDWKLIAKQETDADEAAARARLARKEKPVDPTFYPKIKGASGLYKVKLTNVENHMLVKLALEGRDTKSAKVKPAEIGAYLIRHAVG